VSRKGPSVPLKVQVPKELSVSVSPREAATAPDISEDPGYSIKVPPASDQVDIRDKEIVIHIRFSYKAVALVIAVLFQIVYVYGHAIAQGIGYVP
jgi:hypothetical protein